MIILLEGPDNVGKSTQIKLIQSEFKNKFFHILKYSNIKSVSEEESGDYYKEYYREMFDIFQLTSENFFTINFICDRSHIGEAVYGPIFRNYSGDHIFYTEKYYATYNFFKNIYLITFIDEPEKLIEREDGESQGDNSITLKELEIKKFKEATKRSIIHNKIVININNKSPQEVFKEILIFLKGEQ